MLIVNAIFQLIITVTKDNEAEELKYLIVIDEAHAILENPITTNSDDADFIMKEQMAKIFSELFKEYIENMIIEASTKGIKIKEWRDRNTFEKDGKKYIPLCRLNKIYHETLKAYLVWSDQWIPKSISYKDKKYLYCEEWMYKRIENGFKEK